jgi:hypothetical protein
MKNENLRKEIEDFVNSLGTPASSDEDDSFKEERDPDLNHELYDSSFPGRILPDINDAYESDPCPFGNIEPHKRTEEQLEACEEWYRKKANLRHKIFIQEMIARGDRLIAYKRAYPDASDKSARVNACRLLSYTDISEQIRAGIVVAKKQAMNAIYEKFEGKLTGIDEKRAILAQIIRGEIVSKKEWSNQYGTLYI